MQFQTKRNLKLCLGKFLRFEKVTLFENLKKATKKKKKKKKAKYSSDVNPILIFKPF